MPDEKACVTETAEFTDIDRAATCLAISVNVVELQPRLDVDRVLDLPEAAFPSVLVDFLSCRLPWAFFLCDLDFDGDLDWLLRLLS